MAYNKINFNRQTLIDLTPTTATSDKIISGFGAFGKDGEWMDGTALTWLPPSAELVAEKTTTLNLSSGTDWDEWTPSTTSHTLLAAGTARAECSYTITGDDATTKAAIGIVLHGMEYVYKSGTTMAKAYMPYRNTMGISFYTPIRIEDYDQDAYGVVVNGYVTRGMYYTSATAMTVYTASTYGIGVASTSMSVSSATSASSRTIGFALPAVSARCSSTYFSTTAAGNIDSEKTNLVSKYRIYLIDKTDSIFYKMFDLTNGALFN